MRAIHSIVVHHSVTPRDLLLEKSVTSFNNNHKKRGLHKEKNKLGYYIAYHYVIAGDGRREKTRELESIGNHASSANVNADSVGICLTGNFDVEKPTKQQIETFQYLKMELEKKFGTLDVLLHNQFSSKSCPGSNVNKDILLTDMNSEGRRLVDMGIWNGERPRDNATRLEVAIMIERALKLGSCPHTTPIGEMISSDGTIATIRGFNRIQGNDGVITLSVQDQPHEVDKIKFEILLRSALRNVNEHLKTKQIKRINDGVQADITLHFALPGDSRLPAEFKKESLAFGIPPYEGEHAGKIFVNEKIDRSQMGANDKLLRVVLEHEILHTLNLGHSNVENDIMYYRYNTENNQEYTEGTRQLLGALY